MMRDNGLRKLVIRCSNRAKNKFDSFNNIKFEDIARALSIGEWRCYVSRRDENEFQVSIPMSSFKGQVDLVLTYNEIKFSYELIVFYARKTRFRETISLPELDSCFSVKAQFVFLKASEPFTDHEAIGQMIWLNKKIGSLEVLPSMSVDTQLEIWAKFIEAQSQIIDSLNEPFVLEGEPRLVEETRADGNGVYRYRLDLRLPVKITEEYIPLLEALRNDLGIEACIDKKGCSLLGLDDIFRGIDSVIDKRFSGKYVRDAAIGCVVPVRPMPAAFRLSIRLGDLAHFEQCGNWVLAKHVKVPFTIFLKKIETEGYSAVSMSTRFRIVNVDDLKRSPHVKQFGISFSNDMSFKWRGPESWKKEVFLPEPEEPSTFVIETRLDDRKGNGYAFLESTLKYIYGEENVVKEVTYKLRSKVESDSGRFSKSEWDDIWRDIYALDYKYNAPENGAYIAFDFETKEQLEHAISGLESIGKFSIAKSPRDNDFKFKVKIDVVAKKTENEIFLEKLKKLNGVDFVYDSIYEENGRTRKRSVFVGKLNYYESSVDHLVLYLPYMFRDEKKRTDIFLKFWKDNAGKIDSVHANLIGDRVKLDWLEEAMSKLDGNTDCDFPNGVPVNEKIRDFIFDSSKAASILQYENNDIVDAREFKDFDRTSVLKLNDSQKKAVLKGVEALDLCVLQGPPGTGKTSVIAELIWQHIRRDQNVCILLTSETNVAVDNALARLMDERTVNPGMAKFLSLIKPLRFGKANKFEEEGKFYSIERIETWIDDSADVKDDYDDEVLDEEPATAEEEAFVDVDNNIVQHWMRRIASRSKSNDKRYAEVLKDWTTSLAMPDKETKIFFRDMYYGHVNIVGSTCSSTGSSGFLMEYLRTFRHLNSEDFYSVRSILSRWKKEPPSDWDINHLADILGCDEELAFSEVLEEVKEKCTIKFDAVIMDEASKATPPELLMPLCYGRKSILIGDHRQLAPMLNEKSFKEVLLELDTDKAKALAEEIDRDFVDTSQFRRMILNKKISPSIKATLNIQYRMHPAINDVIKQFYLNDECGGLRCGLNPCFVDSPDLRNPESRYHGFKSEGFISPDVHTIWVNVETPEESEGSSTVNTGEIDAINTILEKLSQAEGFKEYMSHWDTLKEEYKRNEEKEIGVISFYGRQVGRIKRDVRPNANIRGLRLKINTVDKFQGMERNIVIVSTVRSNMEVLGAKLKENTKVGFADSPERLNVALSRARRLLIVVGNKKFFSNIKDKNGNYLYLNAIKEIEKSGKVIEYTDLVNG